MGRGEEKCSWGKPAAKISLLKFAVLMQWISGQSSEYNPEERFAMQSIQVTCQKCP